MIFDTLANSRLYLGYNPRSLPPSEYLRSTDLTKLTGGRHDVQGEDVFALCNLYDTKPLKELKWEAHRKYIDVQFMVDGMEHMGVAPLDDLKVTKEYDEKDDYLLLTGTGTMLHMNPGVYAIFGPADGHMPGVAVNDTPGKVRKIVVKVRV